MAARNKLFWVLIAAAPALWIPPGDTQTDANSAPFTLQSGDWQEVSVKMAAEGRLGILRVYLPAQQQPVEVDWLELKAAAKPKRWEF